MRQSSLVLAACGVVLLLAAETSTRAQRGGGPPTFPLGAGPWTVQTYEPQTRIRVSVVVTGIANAWGMVFLPDGNILVSERRGTLRIVRNGVLDPTPIAGVPPVAAAGFGGLMDIALHPQFESNRWVYFAYVKGGELPPGADYYATTALGRGRFNGTALTDVEDVFVADAWSTAPGGHGSRILFDGDDILYFSQPHRRDLERPQNTTDHVGTILRLHADGRVPQDNPFVGRGPGFRPEIYSYGHRVVEGMALHPETRQVWASEHGPQGGDELNIIQPGGNYGWAVVTYGREYDGTRLVERPWREGMIDPELFWVPSIATSGLMFYTGDKFPGWRGNAFVGAMLEARIPGTGHVQRLVFNRSGEMRREALLRDLRQRVRDVKQGPDGLIYVLTEETNSAILKIEPAN